jgi:hypothetical protein
MLNCMPSFLRSIFKFSFISSFFLSPWIYAASSSSSSQGLRCDAVFQEKSRMTRQEHSPFQTLSESFEEVQSSGGRKKLDIKPEKNLTAQINGQYRDIQKKYMKYQSQLNNIETEIELIYSKMEEDSQKSDLKLLLKKLYKQQGSTLERMKKLEKELFQFTKESLQVYGFKVISRLKPDPEFAKVTAFLNELIQIHSALDRTMKKLNEAVQEFTLENDKNSESSILSAKFFFQIHIDRDRQRLDDLAEANKDNPSYHEAVELYEIYKNGDGGKSLEELKAIFQRIAEPHLEIVEFPNGSAASSMQKKLHLKVIVTPQFEDKNSSRRSTHGSHFRFHDYSFVWLNLEEMLMYPENELFIHGTLLHEAGHGMHSYRRSLGLGTDLDLELFSLDKRPLLGDSRAYSRYMSFEEVFTWVKDTQYLTSNYVMEKSKDNKSLQASIQSRLNGKRKTSKRIIETSLKSLQAARKSIQDGAELQRSKIMKDHYEYSIPLEIDGASRLLKIQIQGKPASDLSQQKGILLDAIQRAEFRVKFLQRQFEGNQKELLSKEELDQLDQEAQAFVNFLRMMKVDF